MNMFLFNIPVTPTKLKDLTCERFGVTGKIDYFMS